MIQNYSLSSSVCLLLIVRGGVIQVRVLVRVGPPYNSAATLPNLIKKG